MFKVLLLLLISTNSLAEDSIYPDPIKTPGSIFENITEKEICVPGYASSVRNVSASLKKKIYKSYNISGNWTGICSGENGCEIDHLISLQLGGDNSQENLWPQKYDGEYGAYAKDKLENRLHNLVCDGKLGLRTAQKEIAEDWIKAYIKYMKRE